MLTTKQAATELGIQPRSVKKLCSRGILKAEKIGRDWLVEAIEIDRYKAERKPAGRPRTVLPFSDDQHDTLTSKENAMQTFIKLLSQSPYGVEIPYAGAYTAYVTPDEERGGYHLSYCKGEMPPHATGHADTAEDAAEQVSKIAELSKARLITED